jgi:hypothetical protein
MANCKGCYCNRFMLREREKACLYLFEKKYSEFRDVCPCAECFVKIICRGRYNGCDNFHNFLNDAAKTFKT